MLRGSITSKMGCVLAEIIGECNLSIFCRKLFLDTNLQICRETYMSIFKLMEWRVMNISSQGTGGGWHKVLIFFSRALEFCRGGPIFVGVCGVVLSEYPIRRTRRIAMRLFCLFS